MKDNKAFDYDKPIPGLSAPDRYTFRIELEEPRPGFAESFAGSDLVGAVAREVVEFYGDQIDSHPVGTGPFKLKNWRRSSEIVFERNPNYREHYYDAEPAPDDKAGQAILTKFKGSRCRWSMRCVWRSSNRASRCGCRSSMPRSMHWPPTLARVPPDFLGLAMPGGKLAPFLAKRGVQGMRSLNPDTGLAYFNMEDPVVGGYTPEKIALRRAIGLAYDIDLEIRQIRRGGIRAQSPIVPHTTGYDPKFKSEMGDYDPARAKALLDLYGYIDRDKDGWRDLPDGKPLTIEMASQPDDYSRKFDELWKKNLNAVGIRIVFTAQPNGPKT